MADRPDLRNSAPTSVGGTNPVAPVRPAPTPRTSFRVERSLTERLDDAAPLIVGSLACAVVGLVLRMSPAPVLAGPLQLWGLFVALSIIAGVGALVSLVTDDPPSEPGHAVGAVRRPESEAPSFEPIPSVPEVSVAPPTRPTSIHRAVALVRQAAPPWLEGEADRELSLSMTTSPTYATIAAPPERRRPPTAETSPSEAIAEIDRLWYDLERLRHRARAAMPV